MANRGYEKGWESLELRFGSSIRGQGRLKGIGRGVGGEELPENREDKGKKWKRWDVRGMDEEKFEWTRG